MRLSIIDQIPGSLLPFIHTLSLTPGLAEMYRAAEPVTPSLVSLQEKPSGNSAETAAAATDEPGEPPNGSGCFAVFASLSRAILDGRPLSRRGTADQHRRRLAAGQRGRGRPEQSAEIERAFFFLPLAVCQHR